MGSYKKNWYTRKANKSKTLTDLSSKGLPHHKDQRVSPDELLQHHFTYEQQRCIHDCGSIQHGCHENVVTRTVNKGNVSGERRRRRRL